MNFQRVIHRAFLLGCLSVASGISAARAEEPYRRQINVVYGETHGVGLVADIFTPTGAKNGAAIVEVTSGGWSSSRGKLDDLEKARVFDILCSRGYTLFAMRPGSISKFSAAEMVAHVEQGIQWVKVHAREYDFDPDRMGLMGASAGGHLASLVAVRNGRVTGNPDASVAAVGVFFPPTDLIQYGIIKLDPRSDNRLGKFGQAHVRARLPGRRRRAQRRRD